MNVSSTVSSSPTIVTGLNSLSTAFKRAAPSAAVCPCSSLQRMTAPSRNGTATKTTTARMIVT
eukprot:5865-Heterococcus_DN1.PRE.2